MAGNSEWLIPAAHKALDDMKYEIAAELGLPVHQASEDYWGDITSYYTGKCGGQMTRRLVAMAQHALSQTSSS